MKWTEKTTNSSPRDEFTALQQQDAFLECKEVFGIGHWYGTLREQVVSGLNQGKWVILEIDVQGALAILERDEFDPITLFIHPGGMEELERRLQSSGNRIRSSDHPPAGNRGRRDAVHASISVRNHQRLGRHRCRRNLPNLERPKGKSSMLEELKEEEIVNKVGGRFKLSTLIQKRLVQLNQGSRALVNVDTHDKMSIVLQEIVEDKIVLNMDNEVETVSAMDLDATVAAAEGPDLEASDLN